MKREESEIYKALERIVNNWETIPIRVKQDEKWQSLFLSEIKDDKEIAKWIVEWIDSRILNPK